MSSSRYTQRRMRYAKRTDRGFRSKSEERVADDLANRGVHAGYESVKLPYISEHSYIPDFDLAIGMGLAVRYLEVKGYWESKDRTKLLLVKNAHPDADIRMVFDNPDLKINPKSKTTYAMWCDKHNIPWCKGPSIPEDWLK